MYYALQRFFMALQLGCVDISANQYSSACFYQLMGTIMQYSLLLFIVASLVVISGLLVLLLLLSY